jgi:hypothetical protein
MLVVLEEVVVADTDACMCKAARCLMLADCPTIAVPDMGDTRGGTVLEIPNEGDQVGMKHVDN